MLLKPKICLTVFTLYEILAVILLHCPRTCDALFSGTFCMDSVYKYFIVCFAFPAIVGLIFMWIMHIIDSVRHRHSLMYKARSAVKDIMSNVRDRLSEKVSAKDLEKMIVAALIVGVKNYTRSHPNARRAFANVLDAAGKEYDIEEDDDDYDDEEYEEDEDDEEAWPTPKSTSRAKPQTKSKSKSSVKKRK